MDKKTISLLKRAMAMIDVLNTQGAVPKSSPWELAEEIKSFLEKSGQKVKRSL